MRHRMKGRKLGRNSSHRKALFKNMAASLILSARPDDDADNTPAVPGRIVTTLAKAKELRPQVEKLVTIARKARVHELAAKEYETTAARGTDAWRQWRDGEQWQKWVAAKAPAVAARRRAFAILRNKEAVDILFNELAERFADRDGGYTRIVRLPSRRLGDAAQKAILEFTGERDRPRSLRAKAPVVRRDDSAAAPAAPSNAEGSAPEPEGAAPETEQAAAPAESRPAEEEKPQA
jgi:large subunit ribosomal protein L17